MKILIDMNFSPDWVAVLTKHSIEAVHWSTIGDPRAQDNVLMEWARENEYTLFTHDLDFGAAPGIESGGESRCYTSTDSRRYAWPPGAGHR